MRIWPALILLPMLVQNGFASAEADAWQRYLSASSDGDRFYEQQVWGLLRQDSAFITCEKQAVDRFDTYFQVYLKVSAQGRAIDIEWYPNTNDGGCIPVFLRNFQFPKPERLMHVWLQLFPGEI